MRTKLRMALMTSVASTLAHPAYAQLNVSDAPPAVSIVDKNGIDLRGGRVARHHFKIAIGDKDNPALLFVAGRTGVASETGTSVGGHVERIRCNQSTYNYCYMWRYVVFGSYAEWHKQESTASNRYISATGNVYEPGSVGGKLTLPDGTVVQFDNRRVTVPVCKFEPCDSVEVFELFASAVKPDGERIESDFSLNNNASRSIVRSTTGYAAVFDGAKSAFASGSVTLYNLATVSCDANVVCTGTSGTWPTYQSSSGFGFIDCISCTITDGMNKSAQRTSSSNGGSGNAMLTTVMFTTRAGRTYSNTIKGYWNGFFQGVSSFTEGAQTTTYDYTFSPQSNVYSPVLSGATARYPNGDTFSYKESSDGAYITSYNNGPSTTIRFGRKLAPNGQGGDSSDIMNITYPEGDGFRYTYLRGNRTSVTRFAKPGSGIADITSTASYPATCTNPVTCNKPTYIIDSNGNRTDFTYDPVHGGVLTEIKPADSAGRRATVNYSYAQRSARYYNETGQIITGPPIWRLTRKSMCNVAASCPGTANETVTTLDYDNNLLLSSTTTAAGDGSVSSTTKSMYDSIGNVIAVDGPRTGTSDTVTYEYDNNRRLIREISPNPYEGNSNGVLIKNFFYDADDRVEKVEERRAFSSGSADLAASTLLRTTVTSYDTAGRKIRETLESGGKTLRRVDTSYDANGRPLCSTIRMDAANLAGAPADACALTTGITNPDRVTKTEYDNQGRAYQIRKAVGTPLEQVYTSLAFTANGKKAALTDANGNRAEFRYDGLDRLVAWYMPSKTTAGQINQADYEAYGYDPAGNMTSWRRRDGRTFSFSYDGLNRVSLKTVPDGCAPRQLGICPQASATRDVYYDYDLRGLQTGARFDSQSGEGVTNKFDALGRMISSATNMAGVNRLSTSDYDASGNRKRLTSPGGTWSFDYDASNRLVALYEGADATGTPMSSWRYDASGDMSTISEKFGSGTSYSFDSIGQLSAYTDSFVGGYGNQTRTLKRNPAGQIASIDNTNDQYAFSSVYNLSRSYERNGLNQYTTAGPAAFSYDENGNLIGDGKRSYAYDAENRLIGADEALISYDPLGRMFEVKGSANTGNQFLYDGDQLIAEYNGSGGLANTYVHGPKSDDPLLWYSSGETAKWLHADQQGSIAAITNGGGALEKINTYDQYGIPSASNRGRFQYTGQAWIPELGMYYYKARIYSPTLGRFLQTDPIGYEDQANLYAYVANDPVNRADPTGMRDIYIGGADDKDATRIVQAYAERQMRLHPDRDIQYFSWADKKGIAAALERGIPIKEPLNVIGHSLGGAEAIRQSTATSAKIDNLITIDPVSSAGNGSRPGNVAAWANVNAAPAARNFSDTVASTGRAIFGTTNTSGADISLTSPSSHGDFPQMMGQIRGQQAIDSSYQNGSKQCTARTGVTC